VRRSLAWWVVLAAALWFAAAAPRVVVAQQRDSARAGAARVLAEKRPPIAPGAAFLRSALLPGLGQAALDRPVATAFFATAELLSLAMLRKASYDLREARRYGADSLITGSFRTLNGREVLDSLGRPIPDVRIGNRWSQGGIGSARATFREDWIAALVFTHLIAGIDAFISAQLWDLPAQVSLRPSPIGGAALHVRLRTR
jgi:hypothetical protein